MKKNAYFGISLSNRINFDAEIQVVKNCLKSFDIALSVFVDKYTFTSTQEVEMMNLAFQEIESCDLVIVELSKKAIGVGVEIGFAKAKNKPIIYMKRKGAEHSTTVGGTADYIIEYRDVAHLARELDKVLVALNKNRKD